MGCRYCGLEDLDKSGVCDRCYRKYEHSGKVKKKSKGIMNIPVESQIRGIKKALANPNTPEQLRAGLRKRLKQLV